MRVVHVTSGRGAAVGGISAAVAGFIGAPAGGGCSAARVASHEHRGSSWTANGCRGVAAKRPDLVHTHGLWLEPSRVARRSARAGIPTVLSPHGMADPWAMGRRAPLKRVLWQLRERDTLESVHCIHALCEAEAHSLRALGIRQKIAIVPNGVELASVEDAAGLRAPWGSEIPLDARVLLFLGRFHEKKGIAPLLEAWRSLHASPSTKDWWLVFVGYADGQGPLQQHERSLPPRVHVHGPAFGTDKAACFAHANAFILPSFSEGLPMAVLEAWSHGLPVLMTKECNLESAWHADAAIEIRPEQKSIADGILSLCALSNVGRRQIGQNGRALVKKRYNWETVGLEMNHVYRWLLGQDSAPGCLF
ncbi:MAG: glycosyltransferase [Myxococcota bacterium]